MEAIGSEEHIKNLSDQLGYYSFNSPRMNVSSGASTTQVNGKWNPIEFGFVNDEEFDDFLSKQARARYKRKRELKKQGLSGKEARRKALEEIGRSKAGQKLSNVGNKVVRGIMISHLWLPRSGFIALVRLNYRGFAFRLNKAWHTPQYRQMWNNAKNTWEKLGGSIKELEKAINVGKKKKVIICGVKCRKQLGAYGVKKKKKKRGKKGFDGSNFVDTDALYRDVRENLDSMEEFYNTGYAEGAVAGYVALGLSVLGAIGNQISRVKLDKREQAQVDNAKDIADKELATLSEGQRKELEILEKQVISASDPRNQIINSPDLSPSEKDEALKVLDNSLGRTSTSKTKKYLLIGGGVLVGIVVILFAVKKFRT